MNPLLYVTAVPMATMMVVPMAPAAHPLAGGQAHAVDVR